MSSEDLSSSSLPHGGEPILVILSGLPGVGKSVVAEALIERVGGVRISSDLIREELAPRPRYTGEESGRVYDTCRERTLQHLFAEGRSVVFDATNLVRDGVTARSIDELYAEAQDAGLSCLKASLTAEVSVLRERIDRRVEHPGAEGLPPAGWDVVTRMMAHMPGQGWTYFDTTGITPGQVAEAILDAMRSRLDRTEAARNVPVSTDVVMQIIAPFSRGVAKPGNWRTHVDACLALQEVGAQRRPDEDPGLSPSATSTLNAVLTQIDHDALSPELLARWGHSSLLNDDPDPWGETRILRAPLAGRLHARAGLPFDDPVGHAGILHTYCYLFSTLETPYGMKRSRWTNGEIAFAAGVSPRLLAPVPPLGTLLRNATALAAHLSGTRDDAARLAPWLDPQRALVRAELAERAIDRADGETIWLRTLVASSGGSRPVLVLYLAEVQDGTRFLTIFPTSSSGARRILGGSPAGRLRFNALLPERELEFTGDTKVAGAI